jgi:putative copper export protein
MSIVLGLVHGIDYALSNWLIGSTIFYCFIVTAGGPEAKELLSDWPKRMRVLLGLTLLSSFAWTLLTVSDMAESWLPSELWTAIDQTTFGHIWCARLALLVGLVLIVRWSYRTRARTLAFLSLVLLLPVFSVLTGHSGAQNNGLLIRVAIDWSHSLAVGVWSGGLWMLYVWLGKRLSINQIAPNVSHQVVTRFSHFAMASTGVIAASGLVMAYLAGVSILHPWATTYGLLIIGKVFFFTAALLAAAINQFIHLRTWTPGREPEFARRVRREVGLELALVLIIFTIAGFLARTATPLG